MARENRDINPVFLKIGLALAFSVGGMLCAFIRNNQSASDPSKSSDSCSNQEISRSRSKSEHRASRKTTNSCQFDPLATDKHTSMTDKDPYLLPEFNDLVKEFGLPAKSDGNSPPKLNSMVKTESHEQEIRSLQNMIRILKEREQNLEIQLLEYHGHKEQETVVKELENRLKLNTMEAKLLALKIDSLQTENRMLESQMADYSKVLKDLEAARATIKVLKEKLRSEAAQNKERILDLQQRVERMQEDERKDGVRIDSEIEPKLSKLKDLEAEVHELRSSNYNLQVEKSELTQKLEHVQADSVEWENLQKQNEELTKEIEQLQAHRCSDVEELVYMRWINACLRYELRNHQPEPGKTMARDLSNTLSPESEERAKRLILEYASQEHECKLGMHIQDLDSDQWPSPESSNPMDSSSSIDDSSSRKNNHKFFRKFIKFLKGKEGHSMNSSVEQTDSLGDNTNSYSDYSFGYLGNSSKHSMDSQTSIRRNSDVIIHKRIDSIAEAGNIDDGKSELVKYAEVLRDFNPKPPTRYRRKSTPFSSF